MHGLWPLSDKTRLVHHSLGAEIASGLASVWGWDSFTIFDIPFQHCLVSPSTVSILSIFQALAWSFSEAITSIISLDSFQGFLLIHVFLIRLRVGREARSELYVRTSLRFSSTIPPTSKETARIQLDRLCTALQEALPLHHKPPLPVTPRELEAVC